MPKPVTPLLTVDAVILVNSKKDIILIKRKNARIIYKLCYCMCLCEHFSSDAFSGVFPDEKKIQKPGEK